MKIEEKQSTGFDAPFGLMAGVLITVTGHYRIFHFLGFGGLFSLLDEHSTTQDWIGFQVLFGVLKTIFP